MKKILSIDGGGTRGIIPAAILAEIESELGKPTKEIFDIAIGTSTGGIIAMLLSMGYPASEVVELYREESAYIFQDSWWDNFRDLGKTLGADYSPKYFKEVFTRYLGTQKMGDISDIILMIPAFNLSPVTEDGKKVNFRPKVFNSFYERDQNYSLVDIACATTAAPTYFPIFDGHFIDGGVAINHPAMSAVAFAMNTSTNPYPTRGGKGKLERGLGQRPSNLMVLSLGTGTTYSNRITPEEVGKGDWGNWQWSKYLPSLMIEANTQTSDYYVETVLSSRNYCRLQTDLSGLEEFKDLKLDETNPKMLDILIDQAVGRYNDSKKEVLDFLNY